MSDVFDLRLSVKLLGILAGFLLLGYGFALAGRPEYDDVSDRYASRISTVGLILVLVATGGFLAGSLISLVLEGAAYVVGIVGGTIVYRRITHNQSHYEKA
ncbi:hypothetical protein [Halococcus sp. PRR34]|uniref:hypothetical protein n=1 Tax=Halococcus sp. PRR34 TaxID=3020830 RepID=UPI0023606309|nr:hypothetical protein [Halococcus sp. PRR34]